MACRIPDGMLIFGDAHQNGTYRAKPTPSNQIVCFNALRQEDDFKKKRKIPLASGGQFTIVRNYFVFLFCKKSQLFLLENSRKHFLDLYLFC